MADYSYSTPLLPGMPVAGTRTATSGISELRPELVDSLRSSLMGQIPQSDIDLLRQHAAEFGVAGGISGSPLAANAGLRSLGLLSLDQTNRAQQLLTPGFRDVTQVQNQANYSGMKPGGTVPATVLDRGGGAPT